MRAAPSVSAPRRPARDAYDAVVDLLPMRGPADRAYTLVKRSFTIAGSACMPSAAEPLSGDLVPPSSATPAYERRHVPLPQRSDFWPRKDATDVIIEGSAYAPGGKASRTMTASAQVGATCKRVAVFGRRPIERSPSGAPRVPVPELFTEMPLSFANAYGGVDPRVPIDESRCLRQGDHFVAVDHPGLYPRNPFGKGYLVGSLPSCAAEMPNLEDPDDLLTEERVVVRDPALWYQQPLPWCFHWMHPLMFPRFVHFLGADAWFPGPDDEQMPEVRRGYLAKGYRAALTGRVSPRLAQDASLGLSIAGLAGGEPVVLEGMHPEEPVLRFSLPTPPRVDFILEGQRRAAAPRLHSVVIRPAEKKLYVVYGADVELHRTFVPGIHKCIPVGVSVDGDVPIAYATPPTVKEQLRAAAAMED
jgi:hypothetical protein